MGTLDTVWLALAGIGAGFTGSVAGLASLISYPALLAVGLPPVSANVSNTSALVFGGVGAVWGSRPELSGRSAVAWRLGAIALAGGVCGAVLLLTTPSRDFALIVPWLIGFASIAILFRPELPDIERSDVHLPSGTVMLGVFFVALYAGYFGAAAGVLLLALLLVGTRQPLPESNAMKNLLTGVANGVAAIAFAAFGPVRWTGVLPLAAGFLIGGRLGPIAVRKLPTGLLRIAIASAGVGLAIKLAIDAYR